MVSAEVGESKCLASDSAHCSAPEIVHRCSRALFWDSHCLSLRRCQLIPLLLLPRVRALPRSPNDRSCRGVLKPPSPRSLFTHACLVSCAAGQSALLVLFVIMLALSLVEHTSAVSTGTVRDPCDQPSSSPRATSSRSPCTRTSCSSSSPGVLLPLSARGLVRDQSSRRVPPHPRSLAVLQRFGFCRPPDPRQTGVLEACCLLAQCSGCHARLVLGTCVT